MSSNAAPRKRTTQLAVRVIGDETLVLDERKDMVHCLPADVARVWDACTGDRDLATVAERAGVDEAVAAASIEQLVSLALVEMPSGVDRRRFLKRSAVLGGVLAAAPVIETVLATPAAAKNSKNQDAVFSLTGCVGNSHKNNYQVALSGFPATANVTVGVAYASTTDTLSGTTNAQGSLTVTGQTPALTAGTTYSVTITVTYPGGTSVFQGQTFVSC